MSEFKFPVSALQTKSKNARPMSSACNRQSPIDFLIAHDRTRPTERLPDLPSTAMSAIASPFWCMTMVNKTQALVVMG